MTAEIYKKLDLMSLEIGPFTPLFLQKHQEGNLSQIQNEEARQWWHNTAPQVALQSWIGHFISFLSGFFCSQWCSFSVCPCIVGCLSPLSVLALPLSPLFSLA